MLHYLHYGTYTLLLQYNIYNLHYIYNPGSDFWISSFRFSCTPHGPSAKFLVENGEYESPHEAKQGKLHYGIIMLNMYV